ncbi:MAG: hypothetical protein ACXWUH_15590 [Burkholderiales bacterium]
MAQAPGARYFFLLIASIGALAIFSSTLSTTPVLLLFAAHLGGFLISLANFHSVYWACAISGVLALALGLMLPATTTRTDVGALSALLCGIVLTSLVEAAQFLVCGAVLPFPRWRS